MFWGWSGCACAGETLVRRGISLDETVSCLYRDGLDMFGAWLVFSWPRRAHGYGLGSCVCERESVCVLGVGDEGGEDNRRPLSQANRAREGVWADKGREGVQASLVVSSWRAV